MLTQDQKPMLQKDFQKMGLQLNAIETRKLRGEMALAADKVLEFLITNTHHEV